MPIFIGIFASLFSAFVGFFGTWVAKKTAFGLAAVATFGVLTVGLMAFFSASIATVLTFVTLPQGVIVGFTLFMPSNFVPCTSAIIAGHIAVAIYEWNVENVRLMAYVT